MKAVSKAIEKHCPHCGEFLGYITAFQYYEELAATWLDGDLCPPYNEGFDVHNCKPFPGLTFQVKHANVYHFNGDKRTRHSSKTWNFNQGKWHDETKADYFVLFGIDEQDEVQTFLMSQDRFVSHSAKNSAGGRILNTTCQRTVRMGAYPRCYNRTPYIWDYHVKRPETELVPAVLEREELLQFEREIAQSQISNTRSEL